ncbi:MAG TPA: response regulator [Trueperaceae bacterium]|nr:response regulator [Trueperaceae bacterium]
MSDRRAASEPAADGVERAARAAGDVTVVIVDDDASVLALVSSVLSRYRVRSFDRPQGALEALRGGLQPDLIVSDVIMPGMTGFELHEAVRQIVPLRSVPFIYLTSMSDRDHIRRGMAQGADDYLTKPFTPEELRGAVRARLERAGVLRGALDDELAITSMGGLGVAYGNARLHWEARKAVELLLFLLAGGKRCTVHEARAELWWGQAAENHLHVLVSRLRKMLAGVATVALEGDRLELRFDGKVHWDAEAFERAAEAALDAADEAAIERAVRLYGGDFLPGFDSPWAEREQTRLEELHLRLLEAAVEHASGDAERQRAQDRLDAYIDLDG